MAPGAGGKTYGTQVSYLPLRMSRAADRTQDLRYEPIRLARGRRIRWLAQQHIEVVEGR